MTSLSYLHIQRILRATRKPNTILVETSLRIYCTESLYVLELCPCKISNLNQHVIISDSSIHSIASIPTVAIAFFFLFHMFLFPVFLAAPQAQNSLRNALLLFTTVIPSFLTRRL